MLVSILDFDPLFFNLAPLYYLDFLWIICTLCLGWFICKFQCWLRLLTSCFLFLISILGFKLLLQYLNLQLHLQHHHALFIQRWLQHQIVNWLVFCTHSHWLFRGQGHLCWLYLNFLVLVVSISRSFFLDVGVTVYNCIFLTHFKIIN